MNNNKFFDFLFDFYFLKIFFLYIYLYLVLDFSYRLIYGAIRKAIIDEELPNKFRLIT